ncbi:transcriptional regulator, LysR family [Pseudoxanthomonas sp. GM95]|uniref:LysR family transcriptional regulator n=1 Tax=Pseudoxanthomonas sp. GM95 TaxID=1881043 RepID=UPI0008C51348|nr:LysR family transcriptional regulator [Pseudoxanthomonas sp. GM95]SEM52211.1 transcriptional regulator, LysR family [Pseudoxanthomonas sp. GM95]
MQGELELLRIFRAAAEAPSFREAAIRLGASPQGVTRAVKQLEQHYGEPLFHRSTRQVRITAFGEALLARLAPTLAQFEDLWRPAHTKQQAAVSGLVRVSVPRSLGSRAVLPAMEEIAKQHPAITLDVRLSDRISDAVDEGIDVGLRVGFMRDSRYVAREAAKMRLLTVASPDLIQKLGAPDKIEDLANLPVAAALDQNTGRPWPWYFRAGAQWTPTSPVVIADDADIEMGAVLSGIAFGQLADYMALPHLNSGGLVRVLESEEPSPWGLYVFRPQPGPVAARVRIVFDALASVLSTLSDSQVGSRDRPKPKQKKGG